MISELVGSILRLARTYTPAVDAANGIAELKPVELNGHPQWLLIRGHDVSKPVLLCLHGGPGISDIWLAHHTMNELERHFICVNWDQRGTGKSLQPRPDPATMTIDQFVRDGITLIELLLSRFRQEKLLLLGHSWGSVMAMKIAAARPDLLYAVIGMGQQVDSRRGEEISYQFVLESARAERNQRAIRALERLGGSDTYRKGSKYVQRWWLNHYRGLMHSVDIPAMATIMLAAPEWSIAECIRFLRGSALKYSVPLMADEILRVNLLQEIRQLSVPAFFFEGRYDYNCPFVLAEEFFASLQAPSKKLIWFERSGHTPDLEEPEKFQRELIAVADQVCGATRPQVVS